MSWAERAVVLASLLAPAAAPPQEGWRHVGPDLELEYPRDHGAHPAYRTEWWYLTGLVESEAGRRFGFQLTIFRAGRAPGPPLPGSSPLRARHVLAGHLAIADVAARRLALAERLRRAGSPLARASEDDLDVVLEDWSLRRVAPHGDAQEALLARAADPASGLALDLELVPQGPLVLHGERGYSQKGPEPGNASAYASWPRLAVRGTLAAGGPPLRVSGEAWFDHEFGTSALGTGVTGWDWLGLRLDDGRELMLFSLRGVDGTRPFSGGTLVERDGAARSLAPGDFELVVQSRWRSPRTGAEYPSRWNLSLPSAGLELEIVPLVRDAELDTARSTGVVYWEGPVEVRGTSPGEGYVELTGYAGTMAGRL